MIYNSELKFRQQVIINRNNIDSLYVFEDKLDSYIFFYCFLMNGSMFATKEVLNNNFAYYSDIYNNLMINFGINIDFIVDKPKGLKYKKN